MVRVSLSSLDRKPHEGRVQVCFVNTGCYTLCLPQSRHEIKRFLNNAQIERSKFLEGKLAISIKTSNGMVTDCMIFDLAVLRICLKTTEEAYMNVF